MTIMRKQSGFTLIEIAIVLVIIGLLLGGVLKGQELITSARVRNLSTHQDGVKAAYFGFLDRYRALPGDYSGAVVNIPNCNGGVPCQNGDNNGQILGAESVSAWEHLSKAGFVTGSYVFGTGAPSATNTPVNPYGALVQLIYDNVYQEGANASGPIRHNLKTGNNVPSDILAEVDRKVDDGLATGGQLRFSPFSTATNANQECFATAAGTWQSANPTANCGATTLF
jgi:prepilin-type N-terminal cleavage/methylation domain-containing protein